METKMVVRRLLVMLAVASLLAFASSCRLGRRAASSAPLPPAGSAPEMGLPGVSGVVLFQDDFQDGQADGWTVNSAWDVQQSGDVYVFRAEGQGGAWVNGGQAWRDYAFRAGVRVEAGSLFLSSNLSQAGRYLLHLRSDGAYLLKEQPAGNYTLLAQTGPLAANAPHSVAIASQGGHLQVYVDNVLWMDYTDNAPLAGGTVAVSAVQGSRVTVDNVLVMSLGSPLPGGIVQAPPPSVAAPDPAVLAPPDGGGLAVVEVEPEEPPVVDEPSGGQPDLTVAGVSMQPQSPQQGQPMVVAVTVQNVGDGQAGAFNIRWNPEGANFVGCSWDVFGLPPGEAVDMLCDYQGYPQAGAFNWGVTVDADGEVAESNEGNNRQSGEIVVVPGLVQEPPPAPTGCRVSGWSMNSVTIAWDFPGDEANIEGFGVYQGTTSLEQWVGPPSREATIGNLQQGVQYHFDVRAYNEAGESGVDACFVDTTPQ